MKCSLLRQWHRLHFLSTAVCQQLTQANRASHSLSQKCSRKFGNRVLPQPDLYRSVHAELDLLSDTADSSSPSKLLTLQLIKVSWEINTHCSWRKLGRCVSARKVTISTILKWWMQHLRGTPIVPSNSQTPKPEELWALISENTGHVFTRASLHESWLLFFSHLRKSLLKS